MKKLKILLLIILIITLIVGFNKNNERGSSNLLNFEDDFFSNFKNWDDTDFSDVNYIASETTKDKKLENAFAKVYNLDKTSNEIRYYYNRIDVNSDNKKEVFVFLVGRMICGSGGCNALLFENDNGEYNLISKFSLVNNPVIISENKTNGWNDIVIPVAGGGIKPFFAQMKFDGKKYPLNPSVQPTISEDMKIKGKAIVADDLSESSGVKF